MIKLQLKIPVLPAYTEKVGRIAAVNFSMWVSDICDEFRHWGYDILSLPNFWHMPPEYRSNPQVHSHYAKQIAAHLRQMGGADYLLSGNTDSLLLLADDNSTHTLGEELGIPTIVWWFDDPRLDIHLHIQNKLIAIYPLLQLLRSESIHHFMLDRSMAEACSINNFFPNVTHLPVATTPERYFPSNSQVEQDTDLVMIGNAYSGRHAREYCAKNLTQTVHDALLAPIYEMKRKNLRMDLPGLLNQWIGESPRRANHPVVQAVSNPWTPETFNPAYYLWKANTFMWCEIRNEAVRLCKERFGEKFALFGKHWESMGIPSSGFVMETTEHRNWYDRSKCAITGNHGQLQTGLPFRVWELAASRLPIVAQACAEIESYFEPGKECEIYESPEHAVEVVERLVADPDHRGRIAEGGYRRSVAQHQWKHRVRTIIDSLNMPANPDEERRNL